MFRYSLSVITPSSADGGETWAARFNGKVQNERAKNKMPLAAALTKEGLCDRCFA